MSRFYAALLYMTLTCGSIRVGPRIDHHGMISASSFYSALFRTELLRLPGVSAANPLEALARRSAARA